MVTKKGQAMQSLWNVPVGKWSLAQLRNHMTFLLKQVGAALLGALLAQSGFAGGVFAASAPFAIALAAAGSVKFLGMAVLGMAAGCLFLLEWPENITAMAACALAGLCNLAFRKIGTRRNIATPMSAFGCALLSGVVALATVPPGFSLAWLYAFCGAVLAGCAAYFIVAAQGIRRQSGAYLISRRECAALLLCCGMLLASLGGFQWGLFRPAHFIGVLFVLASAYCWRESGGAIAGVCAGAALVLANGNPAVTAVFALGGLLAGLLSLHSARQEESSFANDLSNALLTVPVAGGFALACVFFIVLHGAVEQDPSTTVIFAIECLLAILLFVLVPARLWNRLRLSLATPGEAFFAPSENEAGLRISQAAGALRRVGEYVSEVSDGLEKLQAPLEQSIYAGVEESLCKRCVEHPYCYVDRALETRKLIQQAIKQLRQSGILPAEEFAQLRRACGLTLPCRNLEQFHGALLRCFDLYAAKERNTQANTQLRQAAAAQFETVAELMEEVGTQLSRQRAFENEAAQSAARVLGDHGFHAESVCCMRRADTQNAATLTASVRPEREHSGRAELARAMKRATGIAFGPPETMPLSGEPDAALLTFSQQPLYQFSTGAVQMSSSSSNYCGDYFDCFNDGHGREVLIISDGMGTGGRAAVDSALATEIFSCLARSGLSFSGAVRIANQALLLKSCDETLATIDAAGVNLYTGEVEFCKAGGAVSFIRQRGRAVKLELSALPTGILRDIRPAVHHALLEAGDIVVLVSDGMASGQESWLCEALEGCESGDMQAFAEQLAGQAIALRQSGESAAREDDLTVICGMLKCL